MEFDSYVFAQRGRTFEPDEMSMFVCRICKKPKRFHMNNVKCRRNHRETMKFLIFRKILMQKIKSTRGCEMKNRKCNKRETKKEKLIMMSDRRQHNCYLFDLIVDDVRICSIQL